MVVVVGMSSTTHLLSRGGRFSTLVVRMMMMMMMMMMMGSGEKSELSTLFVWGNERVFLLTKLLEMARGRIARVHRR